VQGGSLVLCFCGHTSDRYARQTLQPFLTNPTDEEKIYGHCQQDSSTAHSARYSMEALHELFDGRVISRG
jgi:hypothetical protein